MQNPIGCLVMIALLVFLPFIFAPWFVFMMYGMWWGFASIFHVLVWGSAFRALSKDEENDKHPVLKGIVGFIFLAPLYLIELHYFLSKMP